MHGNSTNLCVICGASLAGKRTDAKYCSQKCGTAGRDRAQAKQYRDSRKEYDKQYRDANKERKAAYGKRYKAACQRERLVAYTKRWLTLHPESRRAATKRYREANRGKVRAASKRYRDANREKVIASNLNWMRNNPDAVRLLGRRNQHVRRSRMKGSGGDFSKQEWMVLVDLLGNKCLKCGTPGTYQTLTVDHVIAVAEGGSNDIMNLQPLCRTCNCRKHRLRIDFRTRRQVAKMAKIFGQQLPLLA